MAQVLPAVPGSPFSGAQLRSSASHFPSAQDRYNEPCKSSASHPDLRSPSLSSSQTSSIQSTPASSLSLDTGYDDQCSNDELDFPAYNAGHWSIGSNVVRDNETYKEPELENAQEHRQESDRDYEQEHEEQVPVATHTSPEKQPQDTSASTPDPHHLSEDDTAVRIEPSQHVDYLSHDWKDEEIWSSWRHIVHHRNVYGERSRLENASWRTWAKTQFRLDTVSPETLNWLKDVDVTWLYGPLQPAAKQSFSHRNSEPVSRLSKTNSFLNKKPILKKRSMSEVMLQKSISASSLIKQAAAAVQAQQDTDGGRLEPRPQRPALGCGSSDCVASSLTSHLTMPECSSQSTSGLVTPENRKHIRFDDKVEQCIAVECKDTDEDDEEDFNHNPWAKYREDDSSSDEGIVMMKRSRRRSRRSSKSSLSGEGKIIAKLPSTTLKYRTDSPDIADDQRGRWHSKTLSPSPSQETLRPANPSANYLLPEDDEDDSHFNPGRAYEVKRVSTPTLSDHSLATDSSKGLRRTASGMLMPAEEVVNDQSEHLLKRVVDTVNTARDIAHVIWNVGWRN